jgi:hypothetical protein
MAVYSQRSILNIVNISNNQILDNNYPIPYDEVCFNGNIIKLPQDEKLYSSLYIVKYLHDLFSDDGVDESLYSDNDFHKDMQLISKLNPNLIFGIKVVVPDDMKVCHEYYLNGKMIEDRGKFTFKYDNDDFEFKQNPSKISHLIDSSDWKDISIE